MPIAFPRRLGRRCLLALGLGVTSLSASAYSELIVFGDSLSDSGQFPDPESVLQGELNSLRFTNRTGPDYRAPEPFGAVSTQRLAQRLDLAPLLPSTSLLRELASLPDGTNYAVGGYTTEEILASITQPDGSVVEVPNLSPAVEALLATLGIDTSRTRDGYLVTAGAADPEALYYVNGGGNDFLDGAISDPASATAAGNTLANGVEALVAAGARTIVVSNVPDIGATPAGSQSGQREATSALGGVFNQALGQRLAVYDERVDIIRLDVAALFEEVIATPADFGLATDVALTEVCFGEPECDTTRYGLSSDNPDPDRLLFEDSVHPTTAGQQILGDYAYALVTAPRVLSLAGELTLGALAAEQRALRNELRPGMQAAGLRLFVRGDHEPNRANGFADDGRPETRQRGAGVGVVVPLARGWVGAAVTRRDADMDAPGDFALDGQTFSVFTRQQLGPVGVQVSLGRGDFELDLDRRVALGQAERTLRGDSDADGWAAELRLDYRLTAEGSAWYSAPFVAYSHAEAEVEGYRERGSRANALIVAEQDVKDRRLELGLLLDRGSATGIGFYGEAAWGRYLDDERDGAEVRLATLPTNRWSGEKIEREADDYLRGEAGLRMNLGSVRLQIGAGVQGQDEWSSYGQLGIGFTL